MNSHIMYPDPQMERNVMQLKTDKTWWWYIFDTLAIPWLMAWGSVVEHHGPTSAVGDHGPTMRQCSGRPWPYHKAVQWETMALMKYSSFCSLLTDISSREGGLTLEVGMDTPSNHGPIMGQCSGRPWPYHEAVQWETMALSWGSAVGDHGPYYEALGCCEVHQVEGVIC